mmetsp:Transcript_29920/g.50347  ORF Transcript_29920/g.50347 Transcript_29920/m.50347 type:complete len:456 (+) Transcript_29920:1136-2503(+)
MLSDALRLVFHVLNLLTVVMLAEFFSLLRPQNVLNQSVLRRLDCILFVLFASCFLPFVKLMRVAQLRLILLDHLGLLLLLLLVECILPEDGGSVELDLRRGGGGGGLRGLLHLERALRLPLRLKRRLYLVELGGDRVEVEGLALLEEGLLRALVELLLFLDGQLVRGHVPRQLAGGRGPRLGLQRAGVHVLGLQLARLRRLQLKRHRDRHLCRALGGEGVGLFLLRLLGHVHLILQRRDHVREVGQEAQHGLDQLVHVLHVVQLHPGVAAEVHQIYLVEYELQQHQHLLRLLREDELAEGDVLQLLQAQQRQVREHGVRVHVRAAHLPALCKVERLDEHTDQLLVPHQPREHLLYELVVLGVLYLPFREAFLHVRVGGGGRGIIRVPDLLAVFDELALRQSARELHREGLPIACFVQEVCRPSTASPLIFSKYVLEGACECHLVSATGSLNVLKP